MDDKEKIIITEAKDLLKGVNEGISKTRDKCWQLVAFMIAIDMLSFKLISEHPSEHVYMIISTACLVCSAFIFYYLQSALFPKELRFGGAFPDGLNEDLNKGGRVLYFSIIKTYKASITENGKLLNDLKEGYKKALYSILFLIGGSFLLIIGNILLIERLPACASVCGL
jgi:hypothetical protein